MGAELSVQNLDAIANKGGGVPDGFSGFVEVLGYPFLDYSLGAAVVVARDGLAEDVARTCVDLEVEEGGVQEDVSGVVKGERGSSGYVELFGEKVTGGREAGDIGLAESVEVLVPCCVGCC